MLCSHATAAACTPAYEMPAICKKATCAGKQTGDLELKTSCKFLNRLNMANLTESKKRDFVQQLIVILQQNASLLTDKGFDPTAKITQLQSLLADADDAEGKQLEAAAAAKDATQLANETLNTVYTDGSATVDLITGLLGKKDNLVLEIKKLRNTGRPTKKDPVTD